MKLHADQLSNTHGAALAARFGALSADHLEYTDEAGVQAMAAAGVVAVLFPGAFYFLRETQRPPVELLRRHRVPIALATDCNPGTSPLTSLLLTMNMGATLFGLTVDECLAGVTREAAARARTARRRRHARGRQVLRPGDLGHRSAGRTGLPHGLKPAICARLERTMTPVLLRPGSSTLAEWHAIYRGRRLTVDLAAALLIRRGADAVDRHRGRGRAGLRHQHRLRQAGQRPDRDR